MIQLSEVKISEIAKTISYDKSIVSKYFKKLSDDLVRRVNKRVMGVSPEAVDGYFKSINYNYFNKAAVILIANICGGVGKTTGINNIMSGLRRITDRKNPIIVVDTDPQASFTIHIFKKSAENKDLLLIDFLEGRAQVDDILTPLNNNIWFLKSNLNQACISLTKPQDVKNGMLRFYNAIFDKFGNNAKILQDHNPNVSTVLASSICAIHQLENNILPSLIIPLRGDEYALNGAQMILNELKIIKETFAFTKKVNIHCYFSSIDNRISTLASVLQRTSDEKDIENHLAEISIRFSDEVHKSVDKKCNVYTRNATNKAAEDYNELIHFIFKQNIK